MFQRDLEEVTGQLHAPIAVEIRPKTQAPQVMHPHHGADVPVAKVHIGTKAVGVLTSDAEGKGQQ
jgi:hypothetical protein